jgi:preprotein translocase subunit SecG
VKNALHRHKRLIAVLFCVLALLLTTLAWAGLSLRDGLAAVRF